MKETVHQRLFICTESLCPGIAGEGRIDIEVVDTTPTKATNRADGVASEIWPSAFVAQAVRGWRAVVGCVSGSPLHLLAWHL